MSTKPCNIVLWQHKLGNKAVSLQVNELFLAIKKQLKEKDIPFEFNSAKKKPSDSFRITVCKDDYEKARKALYEEE